MPVKVEFKKIAERMIQKYSFWQRLEPRARSDNFSESIQVKIRDPLWIIGRQWQLGEFKGEDAGSPILAQIKLHTSKIDLFKAGEYLSKNSVQRINKNQPLETNVEREPWYIDYRMSIQIGIQFEEELKRQNLDDNEISEIRNEFLFESLSSEEKLHCDKPSLNYIRFFENNISSGKKLIEQPGMVSSDPNLNGYFNNIPDEKKPLVVKALKDLFFWYHKMYDQSNSEDGNTWDRNKFEHEFTVSAPGNNDQNQYVLEVPEYKGGDLDWSDFSIINNPSAKLNPPDRELADAPVPHEGIFIPTNIEIPGGPDRRWWAFEDKKIDFGKADVKTTDLGKILLMEFALIHGNDWYQIPVPMEIGSICKLDFLKVTNVFGETVEIERAGSSENSNWQRWDMFTLSEKANFSLNNEVNAGSADLFFMPPSLGRSEDSESLEEVLFLRDEMANKVWAVEHRIMNQMGQSISGYERWRDFHKQIEEQVLKEQLPILYNLFISQVSLIAINIADKVINDSNFGLAVDTSELFNTITQFVKVKIEDIQENMEETIDKLYLEHSIIKQLILDNNFMEKLEIDNSKEFLPVKLLFYKIKSILEAFDILIPAFKQANRPGGSFELLKSSISNIKNTLLKILDPETLSEDEQTLLEYDPEIEEENSFAAYRAMSYVPENWIPYVPEHIAGQNREIAFTQARMVRSDSEGNYKDNKPQSTILKPLEGNGNPHIIYEEAIARNGLQVTKHAQRTRWIDGSTHVWLNKKVSPGKGEGSSGLRFDYLI